VSGPAASLGERLLARPWLAALLAVLAFGVPLQLLAVATVRDAGDRLRDDKLAEARAAATAGADFVASSVEQITTGLVTIAATDELRDGASRADWPAVQQAVRQLRGALPLEVTRIFVEDTAGDLWVTMPDAPEVLGKNFAGRDYFRGVIAEARPYVSEAYLTAFAGAPPAVAVAVPVRGRGGSIVAILVGTIDLKLAGGWLARLRASFADAVIVDGRGRLITSAVSPGTDSLRELSSDPTVAASIAGADPAPVVSDFLGNGPRLVGSGAVRGTGWRLLVAADPAALDQAVAPLGRTVGALLLGFLAIVAAGIYLLARIARGLVQRDRTLRRTNDELVVAGRAKSEFLANMSHELRTPLNAIMGFSDLLSEQLGPDPDPRQQRYLRNIHEAGAGLLEVVNGVLAISTVDAGRLVLRPGPVTLEALAAPVLGSGRAAAAAAGLAFVAEVQAGAAVTADPVQVGRIIQELLSNAVRFTPAGTVTVRLRLDGHDLVLDVADTGIGIDPERRDRLFGLFERVNADRSDVAGTGLGLALVQRLVDLHDGHISVESAPGAGTAFRVLLPGLAGLALERPSGARVLIVDDEPHDAELVAAVAARAGLEVESASTVAAALAAIRRDLPLAVVLDLRLGSERGETVLASLRRDAVSRRVPVVIVSVEDDDGRTRALGANDHQTKPIEPARLSDWLVRATAAAG